MIWPVEFPAYLMFLIKLLTVSFNVFLYVPYFLRTGNYI